ncbi:hypothetical protein D0T51_08705 [Parabacteroides sp. 52]|uniref:acyloxyacyl hydrolase n=1 Tax=unclassified Parabacteroides TaxID=2649774 RepID=UPI0013D50A44|nr:MULTISPECIES: acyloxyacyl hydrolase [unclassified Parabacteroides]MDH6534797.1 hypothetical protein [Parabacteroides sp. PM5-20]NDV55802.1 hypothetical protein [Parabacteroides sp. 52]
MRHPYLLLLLFLFLAGNIGAAHTEVTDTIPPQKRKDPSFLSVNGAGGIVLPTNKYINEGCLPAYASLSVKYGIYSSGDSWQDIAYGMPYYGVGVYSAQFFNKRALGNPISLYLFRGADLYTFNPRLSLKYELNLGMSFGWKAYDAFDNPDNIALGSSVNIHVGVNAYLKHRLSDKWDLHYGVGLSHFSNGAYQLPNKGLNMISPFVELVYNFHGNPIYNGNKKDLTIPPVEKRIDYDFTFTSSSRQIRVDTVGTGLPSRLLDKNFKVFAFSYATMFVHSYKYKWGPSLDLTYDESSDIKAWRQFHPEDGVYYDRVKLGNFPKRFSVGISLKGEITYPYMSFFANLGYNLLHGNKYDYRLYQILGVKAYIKDNIFGTFGIRANRFSKAQYLYWSIGYTLKGKPIKKKKSYLDYMLP